MNAPDPAPKRAFLGESLQEIRDNNDEVSAFYAALRVARDAGMVKLQNPPNLHAACLAASERLQEIADALRS